METDEWKRICTDPPFAIPATKSTICGAPRISKMNYEMERCIVWFCFIPVIFFSIHSFTFLYSFHAYILCVCVVCCFSLLRFPIDVRSFMQITYKPMLEKFCVESVESEMIEGVGLNSHDD